MEDADFNWDEFLEETGASAAPHTSFKHVCASSELCWHCARSLFGFSGHSWRTVVGSDRFGEKLSLCTGSNLRRTGPQLV